MKGVILMAVQKRLYRNSEYAKLGGVCQGVAEYFEIDPTIIRVIWALWVIFYGTGLIAYIAMWIILPEKRDIMSKDVHNPEYTIHDDEQDQSEEKSDHSGPDLSKKD
jgi:phage shock protein PspC (stress-responsive transcriptional regulator)